MKRLHPLLPFSLLLATLFACVSDGNPALTKAVEVDGRDAVVYLPEQLDRTRPAPLLVLLHGYGSSGSRHERYLGLRPAAQARGVVYMVPDGTRDCYGMRHWNARPACCDFCEAGVDDVAYLTSLVEAVRDRYPIDPQRIYLVGHSNGGFMALRLSCERADLFAAAVGIAGADALRPDNCRASEPVHVLQIHGTSDPMIRFDGGRTPGGRYPGAVATVEAWARRAGCNGPETGPSLDLDPTVPGPETQVTRYARGCRPGGSAELWTLRGSDHRPGFYPDFPGRLIDYLLAHSKPAPAAPATAAH